MPEQNGEIPVDLKSLLLMWNMECILSHLVAEKIDLDVLKMMKLPHIKLLLKYFPLGIQIRFEYYFEQWREEIGKPLQISANDDRSLLITKLPDDCKTITTATEMETKSTQTDLIIYNISSIPLLNNESITDDTRSCSNTCAEAQINLEFVPEQLSLDLPSRHISPPPKNQVDILEILKNSSCGLDLLNNYGKRQTFTNPERKLLIETIVDYYIKNEMEFSVEISYALEEAILKMFTSEKLSSYRTAKCGKIFIAYAKAKAKVRADAKAAKAKAAKAKTANAKIGAKAVTRATAKAEDEAKVGESKVVKVGNAIYEISNNMIVDDDFEELYQLSENQIMIQTNSTAESAFTDVSHIDSISDNNESMIFAIDQSDNEDNNIQTKIDADEIEITGPLDTATLIRKMLSIKRKRIEQIDRPFIDFRIPWDKLSYDVVCLLESEQPLGKRLNAFANLIIDELRKISTNVPMRVLRAVNQQAVMRYPHSFLDKDEEGIFKPSTSTALLSRLRNRHTFLNRQDRS